MAAAGPRTSTAGRQKRWAARTFAPWTDPYILATRPLRRPRGTATSGAASGRWIDIIEAMCGPSRKSGARGAQTGVSLAGMALQRTVVAAVALPKMLLCLRYRVSAVREFTRVESITALRHPGTALSMDFMIAVRLSISVVRERTVGSNYPQSADASVRPR